jgi:hypothetical protein
LLAQENNIPGVPVSVVITAEARHGKDVPALESGDLRVREAGANRQITELTHFGQNDHVQILLLIDNSAENNFDVQISSLKQWVNSLPPSVEIGVGYMGNGTVQNAFPMSVDHAGAANSIRVSLGLGGADVSPYDSLSEAIKRWPAGNSARKEVVMITSGIEGLGGGPAPQNLYVNRSIQDAQRAGVLVFGIYNPSAGHAGHTLWQISFGQNLLSQLCDETGGESYITTLSPPVSFVQFLDDIVHRLRDQYQLTFVAGAENKGGLQTLKVSVQNKQADVAAPSAVFVKASK